MGMRDGILERHITERIDRAWPANEFEPHWFEIIAACRGWKPLAVNETMTVRVHGQQFEVRRID